MVTSLPKVTKIQERNMGWTKQKSMFYYLIFSKEISLYMELISETEYTNAEAKRKQKIAEVSE